MDDHLREVDLDHFFLIWIDGGDGRLNDAGISLLLAIVSPQTCIRCLGAHIPLVGGWVLWNWYENLLDKSFHS